MPGMSISGTPVLAMDVWEHAYYLKYQNKRADYIEAFFNVIDWNVASDYYEKNEIITHKILFFLADLNGLVDFICFNLLNLRDFFRIIYGLVLQNSKKSMKKSFSLFFILCSLFFLVKFQSRN